MKKMAKLGYLLYGTGASKYSWTHPDAQPNAAIDPEFYKRQARLAEDAKFDMMFLADRPYAGKESTFHYLSRLEAITALSALASLTTHIGLVATVPTSFTEPYTLARQIASLDHLSAGRAGWNLVTTRIEGVAQNYNRDSHVPHAERYEIAEEFLDVVKGLWDSWEDDAFLFDKASKRFFDESKMHTLNHVGKYFKVKGPLNIARSPQGAPIVFEAGDSDAAINLAAKGADAMFTATPSLPAARALYQRVKQEAVAYGRSKGDILIMPSIVPVVAKTRQEAEEKYQMLVELACIEDAIAQLSIWFDSFDFSRHDLDGKFPNVEGFGKSEFLHITEGLKKMAREENLTLRQVAQRSITPKSVFFGSAEEVADTVQQWLEEDAADGFILGHRAPNELKDFIELVVPILQDRGLFRREYEGTTLRENLGLRFPKNRFAAGKE